MTHCIGSTHVYLGTSDICICGASRWNVQQMYNIPNYVPNPHHPRYSQGPQSPAPEVPLAVFRAAVDAKAQFLSADGLTAYRADRGNPEIAHWDRELKRFDSWWATDEVPGDAVKLE